MHSVPVPRLTIIYFLMQKQCERFKRDRDSFKQLLESAKSTIKELKLSGGRTSKGSTHSGDEDDRSKILSLEQRVSGNMSSVAVRRSHTFVCAFPLVERHGG